jgi:hypothetical protein
MVFYNFYDDIWCGKIVFILCHDHRVRKKGEDGRSSLDYDLPALNVYPDCSYKNKKALFVNFIAFTAKSKNRHLGFLRVILHSLFRELLEKSLKSRKNAGCKLGSEDNILSEYSQTKRQPYNF